MNISTSFAVINIQQVEINERMETLRKGYTLVTSWPYRFIRHPMYAAIFIIRIGISLISSNWIIALSYMLPVICMYLVQMSDEEKMIDGSNSL